MLPAYLIPETMTLKTLLKEFRAKRQQMATVIDEFGGTAGLVTLEDVLEEIVGEFEDEYSPRAKSLRIRRHGDHLLIDPRIRIDEFTEAVGAQIPPGDYTTLSGFIYQRLERIPVPKDRIVLPDCVLTVDQLDGPRIVQISCTIDEARRRTKSPQHAWPFSDHDPSDSGSSAPASCTCGFERIVEQAFDVESPSARVWLAWIVSTTNSSDNGAISQR